MTSAVSPISNGLGTASINAVVSPFQPIPNSRVNVGGESIAFTNGIDSKGTTTDPEGTILGINSHFAIGIAIVAAIFAFHVKLKF